MTDHLVSDLTEQEDGTCSDAKIAVVVSHQLLRCRPQPSNQQMTCLFRVYCIFLLRIFGLAVVECLAVMDDSIKTFFAGQGGVVVVVMTLIISFIISGYMSLSDRCSPDNPSNRGHLITLTLMEAILWSGITVHLFHIDQDLQHYMMDVAVFNSSMAVFFIFHILFFFNDRYSYHMLYGILLASLCTAVPITIVSVMNSHEEMEWDFLSGHRTFTIITMSTCMWMCCVWYSVETHLVVRYCHRYTFNSCIFLVLCIAYFDVWNIISKCKCTFSKPFIKNEQSSK